jgi:hypothetical protein
MGKADDETIVGGKWYWSTFAQVSFVIQRYIDVVQIRERGSKTIDFGGVPTQTYFLRTFFSSERCLIHQRNRHWGHPKKLVGKSQIL